jgi:hypothetical protein
MEGTSLANLIADIGSAASFGIASFMLLRNVLKEGQEERKEWMRFLQNNSDRNLNAIKHLEEALTELRLVLRERNNNDK